MDERLRVVVIEDHGIVRDGLARLLGEEADICLVGVAADGRGGLRLVERAGGAVDVVVTDVGLPDLDGAEVARRVKVAAPGARVVALTMHAGDDQVQGLLEAGADGYLLKQAAVGELVAAIRAVARGETVLSPAVARRLATRVQRQRQRERLVALLSGREREILGLLAQGATSKEIGTRLAMSTKTVENHRARILNKLGAANTPAAIALAAAQQLLPEDHQFGQAFI